MTHTPGPWAFRKGKEESQPSYCVHSKKTGDVILMFDHDQYGYGNEQEVESNAHLIAAAPDLLEALESIVALSEGSGRLDWPEYIEAQKAIKKAKGL